MAGILNQQPPIDFFQQGINQAAQKGGVQPSQLQQAVQQQLYNQPAKAKPKPQSQMTLMEFIRMLGGQQ